MTYPVQVQMRYIMEWFHEWSELQRGDFIPVLAQKLTPTGYINGLVSGVANLSPTDSRPPSLFQCRVKLFNDWSDNWSNADKELLLSQIKSSDSTFASKYEEEVRSLLAPSDGASDKTSPSVAEVEILPPNEAEIVNAADSE